MAAEPLEIKLPESFFSALSEIKDSVDEGFDEAEDKATFYSDNIANASGSIQKIIPVFNDTEVYKKIGESFFKGGVKAFFDYWSIIKKEEDYVKKKEITKDKSLQKIIINFPEKKEPEEETNSFIKSLSMLLGLGATALAGLIVTQGNVLISELGEIFFTGLKKLNIFNFSSWVTRGKLFSKGLDKFTKPFDDFIDLLSGKGLDGSSISKGTKTLSKVTSSITSILAKGSMSILGKMLAPLKFIPFLGCLIGLGQSVQRFEKGEYIKGTLELVSAIMGVIPGVGWALATGLNFAQILWDKNIGAGSLVNTSLGASKTIALQVMSLFPKLASKLLKPLTFVFKKIPFIGSLVSFGFATKNFIDGDYTKGTLNIAAGIASIFPGIGTAIAIGLDVLNYWLTETDSGEVALNYVKNTSFGQMFSDLRQWASSGLGKVLKYLPGIGGILTISDALDLFKNGSYIQGLKMMSTGIMRLTGLSMLTGGIDLIEYWISGSAKDDVNPQIKNNSNSIIKNFGNWLGNICTDMGNWFSDIFFDSLNLVKSWLPWTSNNKEESKRLVQEQLQSDNLEKKRWHEAWLKSEEDFNQDSNFRREQFDSDIAYNSARQEYLAKRQQFWYKQNKELPYQDINKGTQKVLESEIIDNRGLRTDKTNEKLRVEINDAVSTNNDINDNNIKLIRQNKSELQQLTDSQIPFLAKHNILLVELIQTLKNKSMNPVNYNSISNNQNTQQSSKGSNSTIDPRYAYGMA